MDNSELSIVHESPKTQKKQLWMLQKTEKNPNFFKKNILNEK